MHLRHKRSRLTRVLIDLAWERFDACEVCRNSEAFDSIEEALAPLRLKRRESKRLLQNLSCPNCESRIPSGMLVVKFEPEQVRQYMQSKKFDRLYLPTLRGFRQFIIDTPMLASGHPFGKLLSKVINRAKKTMLQPSVWYRATSAADDPNFEPQRQAQAVRAYRFNQIGQVAWYLGSDEKTAAVERLRKPRAGEPLGIAKIRIDESIVVLDLRATFCGQDPVREWILRNVVARRFISEPVSDADDSRPEYRVPQFVADLARRRNFGGILYDSTRPSAYNNPEAAGHNLVVFSPIPKHTVESATTVEFVEADYDVMSASERWPLRCISDTK